MAITITESASSKISSILIKRQTPDAYLRLALKGGGCSGFVYHYEFITEPKEKDKIFEIGGIKVCVDIKSYLFLNGMEIDYEEGLMRSGIIFNNPNAKRACGCGESITF